MKVFLLVLHWFCKDKTLEVCPEIPAVFRLLVLSLQADLGKDAWCSNGEGMLWILPVPRGAVDMLCQHRVGTNTRQLPRMGSADGSIIPESRRMGINPAKGRGCLFGRVAVCWEHPDAQAWGPYGVQGWVRCSPGLCPSLAPPWSCHEDLSNSLLSRLQFPPCCVSVQCFEALSFQGEST